MSLFTIKQGDRLPALTAVLRDTEGPVDLSAATAVALLMRLTGSTTPLTLTGTTSIVDAAAGEVRHAWGAGDTTAPGVYEAEWEVTFPGGTMTFPSSGWDTIHIYDDIA